MFKKKTQNIIKKNKKPQNFSKIFKKLSENSKITRNPQKARKSFNIPNKNPRKTLKKSSKYPSVLIS
jgi:hypothetical protein